jgi:transketolase
MRRAVASTLYQIAESDPRLLLMTADLGFMVWEEFGEAYPSRFINVGVAEANMMGLATGLASCGYIPFVYSIATFASMRCYEQARNGPIYHNLPVRILGVGGGFEYGHGGFTHHALEDLGITRLQPNLTVIAPADRLQAAAALRVTYDLPGPIYYRMGKNDNFILPGLEGRFRLGRLETIRDGSDMLMLTLGSISEESFKASEMLWEKGIRAHLSVVSSLRPAPTEDLRELLGGFPVALTVEEHYIDGGLGSVVSEVVAENRIPCRVIRCGIKRVPTLGGGESFLRRSEGLNSEGIFRAALAGLDGKQ